MTTTQKIGKKRETQELLDALKSIMDYGPNTGKLSYKVDRSGGAKIGDEPGRGLKDKGGYKRFVYKDLHYSYHRVCWAIHYGYWPEHTIHHKDNNPSNNVIDNIEDVTQAVNNKQKKPYKGRPFKGLHYRVRDRVWTVQKQGKHYGSYKCFGKAYKKAKEVFTNT